LRPFASINLEADHVQQRGAPRSMRMTMSPNGLANQRDGALRTMQPGTDVWSASI